MNVELKNDEISRNVCDIEADGLHGVVRWISYLVGNIVNSAAITTLKDHHSIISYLK